MAKMRPRALQGPYSAYYRREVPPEDAELTHVGPSTPCGEYLRRFWQPVALTDELQDLPLALQILGEELVLFRDRSGQIGLLQRHCSHRGTSLEYGLISERGIRCCYHGWLFDVDGRVLETPGEPATSTYKERIWHGAYPTYEYRGLVFAYLGPPEQRPPFPIYDTFDVPGRQLVPRKLVRPCNWLQTHENAVDQAHTVFLHTRVSGAQFTEEFGELGYLEWRETALGIMSIHTRRIGDYLWVRTNDIIMPNIRQIPRDRWIHGQQEVCFERPIMTTWAVPIDDTNTLAIGYLHWPAELDPSLQQAMLFGNTADRPYEERQRVPGDYDAQVSQRPIAVHALEHLATTDRGVIMLRRLLRQAIRAVQRGEDPRVGSPAGNEVIRTHAGQTVVRVPPAPSPEADHLLLRDMGREIAARHNAPVWATREQGLARSWAPG